MRRAKRRQRAAQSSRLPEVVVAYSGYLNVAVPEHGASARRHVIDPLQADTIVSGSYKPTDCGGSEAVQDKPRRYRCLWSNLVGLEPITSRELNRKLRDEEIRAIVERAPHWPAVKAAFNPAQTAFGMTVWAPLLGSPRGHMIHQIRDYSLLYKLLLRHERARGTPYERVIFSRLELAWLAPHPPLELLHPALLWIPQGTPRMNDRHVVMARAHATVWMRRWELFRGRKLLQTLPLASVVHDGPEDVIENLLVARGINVGEMPLAAYLPCCLDSCWLKNGFCYRKHLGLCQPSGGDGSQPAQSGEANVGGANVSFVGGCPTVHGKYMVEVTMAAAVAAEAACARRHYVAILEPPLIPTQAERAARESGAAGWVCREQCFWSLDGSSAHPPRLYRGRLSIGPAASSAVRIASAAAVVAHPALSSGGEGGGGEPSDASSGREQAVPTAVFGRPQSYAFTLANVTNGPSAAEAQCRAPAAWRSGTGAGAGGWDEAATWSSERAGYCAETTTGDAGDCERGERGSWRLTMRHGIWDEYACVRHCVRSCPRCRYVSVSLAQKDCSWYHSCDMRQLHTAQPQLGFRSFAIVRGEVGDG